MNLRKFAVITVLLLFSLSVISLPAFAVTDGQPKIIDNADLFSDEQELELSNRITEINGAYDFEVVIHTTPSCSGLDIRTYADDFYDYAGYGENGVILVVDMGEREYYISTKGYGITAFTNYGITEIENNIAGSLSGGDFYSASNIFLTTTVNYLKAANSGTPYDYHPVEKKKGFGHYFLGVLICTLISAAIGGVSVLFLKSGMNTAQANNKADAYIRKSSMNVTDREDMFLYHTVTRRSINNNSSGGSGGSSTHRSSSGSIHGGGGGHF